MLSGVGDDCADDSGCRQMTRNDIFRRRLGRQINVRHDHDVGRCVGFDIIMQQFFTRLCCKDAADKTVILLHLSWHATRIHVAVLDSWRFCKKPCKRHRQRSSLQVATCRRTDQLQPAIVDDDVAQHDPRTRIQRKVVFVAIKRGFPSTPPSSRGTPMRVFFVPILRFTRILCLEAISSRSIIDDT